jgi:hypothetical protein
MPEGDAFTLPDPGGISAVDDQPSAADPAVINLGDIETWEDSKVNEQLIITKKPVLGTLVTKNRLRLYQELSMKFTTNSLTRLAIEMFYGSATRLSGAQAQFVPLAQLTFNGWLYLMRYTHENELVQTANLWVELSVSGGIKGGDNAIEKPEFEALLLQSDLNTMSFGEEGQVTP